MKEKTEFIGVETRDYCPFVRPSTEELLKELLKNTQPKSILEIGTFLGYSASLMAEICSDAKIITLEKNEQNFLDAQKNLATVKNVEIVNCDALEFLENRQDLKFDFVFLDGPKGQYFKYLPYLKQMLSIGGILVADDILFYGLVDSQQKIEHKHRSLVNNLRKFINMIKNDVDFETKIYDFDDGVAVITKIR